jgi:hypothetical protein
VDITHLMGIDRRKKEKKEKKMCEKKKKRNEKNRTKLMRNEVIKVILYPACVRGIFFLCGSYLTT